MMSVDQCQLSERPGTLLNHLTSEGRGAGELQERECVARFGGWEKRADYKSRRRCYCVLFAETVRDSDKGCKHVQMQAHLIFV